MRKLGIFLGFVLILARAAGAQSNSAYALVSPAADDAAPNATAPSLAAQPSGFVASTPGQMNYLAVPSSILVASDYSPASSEALPAAPEPAPVLEGQVVQGVYPYYYWQAYVGYTYVRFFEVPGTQINTNGLNFSAQYYFKDWLAFDGEFVGTFGSQLGCTAKYLMALGGVRLRKAGPYGIEMWAHLLGGGAHYLPQTAYGNQHSLAYEAGGGVDINARNHRLAYRLAVDAAGTNYFNTYQVSPKVSFGVVFKF